MKNYILKKYKIYLIKCFNFIQCDSHSKHLIQASTKSIKACLFFNSNYKTSKTHKAPVFTAETDRQLSVSGGSVQAKNVPNQSSDLDPLGEFGVFKGL